MLKPITLWDASAGPNPWKVVIILEELGLPYNLKLLPWEQLVNPTPGYLKINPTGKVPAMEDPNTDLVLCESGAIILYLIEQYDNEKKLTYTTFKEKHLLNQWLMFQMSQQGPYYGQVGWFNVLHPEKVPSAIDRYVRQCERILGVLDGALEGKTWLVGDKCSYADLLFFMWNIVLPLSMLYPAGQTPLSKYPNVLAWHERMAARESIKKTLDVRKGCMDSENLAADAMPTDKSEEEIAALKQKSG